MVTRTASWSYRELDAWTRDVRRILESNGVSPGDVLAVHSEVRPAVLPLLWATWRIGALIAPLSTREPAATLSGRIRLVDASHLITEKTSPEVDRRGREGGGRISVEGVPSIALDSLRSLSPASEPPDAFSREPVSSTGVVPRDGRENIRASDPASCRLSLAARASVIFTSGSTGTPKAAVHRFQNHYFSALGSNQNIDVAPEDRWLASLPWYHVGGLAIFVRCALSGATVAMPEPGEPLVQGVKELTPTHLSLVSTQLQRLLRTKTADADPASGSPSSKTGGGEMLPGSPPVIELLRQARAILLGGGAMPRTLIDRAVDLQLPIHTSYGCTEMASQITTTPPGSSREMLGTSGLVLPHRTVAIGDGSEASRRGSGRGHETGSAADEAAEEEAAQEEATPTGEIRVGGPPLFAGYVAPPPGAEERGATGPLEDPRDDDGLYPTGDLGYIDKHGRLHVTGRLDHLIVSGGENIQPEEIERRLNALPDVRRAVVVGVPDPKFGERPVAFIDWAGPARVDLDAELRRSVPGYKVPDAFYDMPADPTSGAMKVDRRALKATACMLRKRE